MRKKLIFLTMLCPVMAASAQNIDFDFPGRNTAEVTEPNYIPWPVGRTTSETKTFDNGMTITVFGEMGANAVGSNWNKTSVQAGHKLFGDGVLAIILDENNNMVKATEGSTALTLRIEGLSPGAHSLIAYHHNTDKGQILPPVDVEVDGEIKVTGALYSSNKDDLKKSDVGSSYVEFDAIEGKPVVIRYITRPAEGVSYSTTSVMVCGLEFDTNPYGILDEYPENHDFHVAADDGSLQFAWKGADIAVSHKLVFGTDSTSVADAILYNYLRFAVTN